MNKEEYIRAFKGNVKNNVWSVNPAYKVGQEEAEAVAEALQELDTLKKRIQDISHLPFFYHLNIEAKPVKVFAYDQIVKILAGEDEETRHKDSLENDRKCSDSCFDNSFNCY